MRKIATVFAVGVILVALVGCVPGETVVTISADDVGCVMTGGVGRAEVVTTLKSSIPNLIFQRCRKRIWQEFEMGALRFEKSFYGRVQEDSDSRRGR